MNSLLDAKIKVQMLNWIYSRKNYYEGLKVFKNHREEFAKLYKERVTELYKRRENTDLINAKIIKSLTNTRVTSQSVEQQRRAIIRAYQAEIYLRATFEDYRKRAVNWGYIKDWAEMDVALYTQSEEDVSMDEFIVNINEKLAAVKRAEKYIQDLQDEYKPYISEAYEYFKQARAEMQGQYQILTRDISIYKYYQQQRRLKNE